MTPIKNLSNIFGPAVVGICHKLQEAGYDAVIVGGPVRDFLMGSKPNDVDIATSATPNIVRKLFPHTYVQGSGEKHGTIGVVVDSESYEVTTYRLDVTTDGRHAQVAFTEELEEDLLRRDFTINAIAIRPHGDGGEIVDPFGGAIDIEKGVIRAVGDPSRRFQEDYLRIMRAYRFAARLGFAIESETRKAMRTHMGGLQQISRERIREELLKMMAQTRQRGRLANVLRMMQEDGVFARVLPELEECVGVSQNEHHAFDVFNHLVEACDAAGPDDPRMRFAMLLHDIGKPHTRSIDENGRVHFYDHETVGAEIANQICRRLAFSNEDREWICEAIQHHMRLMYINQGITDRALRRIANKLNKVTLEELLKIRIADKLGSGIKHAELKTKQIEKVRKQIEEMRVSKTAVKTSDLEISGHDIMAELDLPPGPHIGHILSSLLEAVLDNPALNTKEDLLELAKDIYRRLHGQAQYPAHTKPACRRI